MSVRRVVSVLSLLVCAAAFAAPPADAAKGLSMEKARQTAAVYAAELCAADKPQCTGYEVGTCARLSPKKVLCNSRLDRKKGEKCTYKITIKKINGQVKGKLGEITCT